MSEDPTPYTVISRYIVVRCLVTGKLYPPPVGTDDHAERYAAMGDLIHVAPKDAAALVAAGLAEHYAR